MSGAGAAATIEALVIELDRPGSTDELLDEFHILHSREVLRVIDVVIVNRDAHGEIEARGRTELSAEEAAALQHSASEVLGFGAERREFGDVHWDGTSVLLNGEDVQFIAGMLKPGRSAIAVVFEHRWAQRLGELLHERGIRLVEDNVYTAPDPATPGDFPLG